MYILYVGRCSRCHSIFTVSYGESTDPYRGQPHPLRSTGSKTRPEPRIPAADQDLEILEILSGRVMSEGGETRGNVGGDASCGVSPQSGDITSPHLGMGSDLSVVHTKMHWTGFDQFASIAADLGPKTQCSAAWLVLASTS